MKTVNNLNFIYWYIFDYYLLLHYFFICSKRKTNDQQNVYSSFNTRFWIAENKLKIIKEAEKKSVHAAASNLFGISRKAIRYWIQQIEELMEVTNEMNTIIIHYGNAAKNTITEWVDEIWYSDFIITNQMI